MKFGICNETFGDWPVERALSMARQAGYTGWEVAPYTLTDNVPTWPIESRQRYRDQVEQAGLEVIGLHWLLANTSGLHLTTSDSAVRHRTAGYLIELTKLCHDLGGRVMVLGSPGQRNFPAEMSPDQAMDNAAEVLRHVAPALEDHQVTLAIEPLGREEGNFLNTAQEARRLLAMVDHPGVRLHLDVKAMSDEQTPIADIIKSHADIVAHFHANDPNRQGPGMGKVDYAPIAAALKEIDYDGWISVEVFDYAPGIEHLVTESMSTLRRHFG